MTNIKKISIIAAIVLAVGLIITAIGFVLGGAMPLYWNQDGMHVGYEESVIVDVDETFTDIKSVDIASDDKEVILKEGKEFRVTGTYDEKYGELKLEQKGDTLVVSDIWRGESAISFFDFGYYDNYASPTTPIVIEYPKGFEFNNVSVNSSWGDIELGPFTTKNLNIGSSDNKCTLTDVKAENAEIQLYETDFIAENFETGGLAGDWNDSDVRIKGILRGTSEVSGYETDLYVDIQAKEADFDYDFASPDLDYYDIDDDYDDYNVMINGKQVKKFKSSNGSKNKLKFFMQDSEIVVDFKQ